MDTTDVEPQDRPDQGPIGTPYPPGSRLAGPVAEAMNVTGPGDITPDWPLFSGVDPQTSAQMGS